MLKLVVLLEDGVVQVAGEPSFEQRGHHVEAGKVDVCWFGAVGADERNVLVAGDEQIPAE